VTIAELKKAKDIRPFRSLLLRMADGREIEVRHPDAVAWEDDSERIAVCILAGGAWEVITVSLATSLTIPAAASGNADWNGGG
jgi:hypothetical protein